MESKPSKTKFRIIPFSIHATRGLLRDERSRRKAMNIGLVVTICMLLGGVTVLHDWLDPHEHRLRFILFWFVCAWGTILVLLLGVFDLLLIRAQGRAAEKAIREQLSEKAGARSAESRE